MNAQDLRNSGYSEAFGIVLASQYPEHDAPVNIRCKRWLYLGTHVIGKPPGRWYYFTDFGGAVLHPGETRMGGGSGHYFIEVDTDDEYSPEHTPPAPPLGKLWIHANSYQSAGFIDNEAQTAGYVVRKGGRISGPFVRRARDIRGDHNHAARFIAISVDHSPAICKRLGIVGTEQEEAGRAIEMAAAEQEGKAKAEAERAAAAKEALESYWREVPPPRAEEIPDVTKCWKDTRPCIVVICGSQAKAAEDMKYAARRFTLEGWNVLFPFVEEIPRFSEPGQAADCKRALDALHLRKIESADLVFVCNPGGYIGESVRNEIAHAVKLGKPVRFDGPGGPEAVFNFDESKA